MKENKRKKLFKEIVRISNKIHKSQKHIKYYYIFPKDITDIADNLLT